MALHLATRPRFPFLTCRLGMIAATTFLFGLVVLEPLFPQQSRDTARLGNPAVEILHLDDTGVVLGIDLFQLQFEPVVIDGQVYERPVANGLYPTGDFGAPELPSASIVLSVPPGAEPTIQVLSSSYRELSGRLIAPIPTPDVHTDTPSPEVHYRYLLADSLYRLDGFYPENLAGLSPIEQVRGSNVVRVTLYPVTYNPSRRQLRVYNELIVEVRYNASSVDVTKPRKAEGDPYYDAVFQNWLANPEQAKRWKLSPMDDDLRRALAPTSSWYDPSATFVKITVDQDGMYRILPADLRDAGIALGEIDPRSLRMFYRGVEIPLYVSGEEDGVFDVGDSIEFYGRRNRPDSSNFDFFSDDSVYWLTWGGEQGRRYTNHRPVDSPADVLFDRYRELVHLEVDSLFYRTLISINFDDGEGWVWRYFLPGDRDRYQFNANLFVAEDTCALRVKLWGTTRDRVNPDHHVRISVNNHLVADEFFDGKKKRIVSVNFPTRYLREGTNEILVESVGGTGAVVDQFYLDWIEIEYPRYTQASDDRLTIREILTEPGSRRFNLSSFSDSSVRIYDLIGGVRINPTSRGEVLLRAESAGFDDGAYARFALNQETFQFQERGYHLVTVDTASMQVLDIRHFDTFASPDQANLMADFINSQPSGQIVLAAVSDEGSANMTTSAYEALESIGSRLSREVRFRDSWAIIGRRGSEAGSVPEVLVRRGQGVAAAIDTVMKPAGAETYGVSFSYPAERQLHLFAVSDSGVMRPKSLTIDTPSDLHRTSNAADLILIFHKTLLDVAVQLAEYRRQQGLRVAVVDVEDVYDEFNFGMIDPRAIKDFLKYAYENWTRPAPAFVLFLGDASWDAKFNMSESTKRNLIPSFGYPASDNWFVCFDGEDDFLPEMFVGRIPAQTPSEAQTVMEKIVEYEGQSYDLWNKRVLLLSGGINAWEQSIFLNQTRDLIRRFIEPSPFRGKAIVINKTADEVITYEYVDDIRRITNAGVLWINFVGHAASTVWDISSGDPYEFENYGRYPFVTAMSCYSARFSNPILNSLGEDFVLAERRAAVAYWGATGFGYIFQDKILLDNLFGPVMLDSLRSLGQVTTLSKLGLWARGGTSRPTVNVIQQYTLLGDPSTALHLARRPDLAVKPSSIRVGESSLALSDSSAVIDLKLFNYGLDMEDSVQVRLVDVDENGVEHPVADRLMFPPLAYSDSQLVAWDLGGREGIHTIVAEVDPLDVVREADETNNRTQAQVYVYPSTLSVLKPQDNALVSETRTRLTITNPFQARRSTTSFFFEVDRVASYDSPGLLLSGEIRDHRPYMDWQLTGLSDNQTYFWRVRSFNGVSFSPWTSSSFHVDFEATGYGWHQSAADQFGQNQMQNLEVTAGGLVLLAQEILELKATSGGFLDGNFANLVVDGEFVGSYSRGHNLVILDPTTGAVVADRTYDTFADTNSANEMAAYLNSLPEGMIVLVAIMDEGTRSMTELGLTALESLGSRFARLLGYRDSWAMIGRKGAPPGSVPEEWKPSGQGSAGVVDTVSFYPPSGWMTSHPIGPAASWKDVRLNYDLPAHAGLSLDILGSSSPRTAVWDTLYGALPVQDLFDISPIDASRYAYLRLVARFTTTDGKNTPALSDWRVRFEPVGDLAVGLGRRASQVDTVVRGGTVKLDVTVYNPGLADVDSAELEIMLKDPNGARRNIFSTMLRTVTVDSSQNVAFEWSSTDRVGPYEFFIEIDPEGEVRELAESNNIVTKQVYVAADTVSPRLRITFDGIEIATGDFVSPSPSIVVELFDNAPVGPDDTSKVQLFLDAIQVPFSGDDSAPKLVTIRDESDLRAKVLFRPELEEGAHSLELLVRDQSRNIAYQRLDFQVSDQFRLRDVLNYPNPFATSTTLTYRLTQPADRVTIRIYTIGGKLIHKIDDAPGYADFNMVEWDGRDRDGDPLANGVYLYKVTARRGDEVAEVLGRIAILR